MADEATGRVLQVNVSPGGVPKRPVAQAWVGRFGLEGDGHAEPTEHGGPHRAVCLFGIEAIRRLAAEGHPIAPGSCGENLTTEGIELGSLPVGTRLAVGERLVLELSKPVTPCKTIAGSFVDGRFARISPELHPLDARMYARVLVEGPVRPGDPIRILPPLPESDAVAHLLLDRIEAVERFADRERWQAAARLGWPIEIVDDGELAMAVSTALPEPAFNWVDGLRTLPHLLDRIVERVKGVGGRAWLPVDGDGLPSGIRPPGGTRTVGRLAVFAIEPDRVRGGPDGRSPGLVVEEAVAGEEPVVAALLAGGGRDGRRLTPIFGALLRAPHHTALLARVGSVPVGAALLVTRRRVGLVRHLAVPADRKTVPTRGGGADPTSDVDAVAALLLRRAAERAMELDCDLVAAVGWVGPGRRPSGLGRAGAVEAESLGRAGLVKVAERRLLRLDGRLGRDQDRSLGRARPPAAS